MADVLMHPTAARVFPLAAAPTRTEAADAFLATCQQRLINNHAARGYTTGYSEGCLGALNALLQWSDQSLVGLTPAIYEAWCKALGERGVRRGTQRTHQSRVRQVIKYLHGQADLQNEAERCFGQRLVLFAHAGNSLVHRVVDETEGLLRPMTYEEVDTFFEALDLETQRVEIEHPRRLLDLLRDKAIIYVMYVQGLRLDELSRSNTDDWSASPSLPEGGKYGRFRVREGKGSKGSGKRGRTIDAEGSGRPKNRRVEFVPF